MALADDEAKALARALADVQKHYPGVIALDPKYAALAMLGITSARIYGKRVLIAMNPPTRTAMPGATMAPPLNVTPVPTPEETPAWFADAAGLAPQ